MARKGGEALSEPIRLLAIISVIYIYLNLLFPNARTFLPARHRLSLPSDGNLFFPVSGSIVFLPRSFYHPGTMMCFPPNSRLLGSSPRGCVLSGLIARPLPNCKISVISDDSGSGSLVMHCDPRHGPSDQPRTCNYQL